MKNTVLPLIIFALLFSGCVDKPAEAGQETAGSTTIKEVDNMANQSLFRIISPAYLDGAQYPDKYTCDGQDISPQLVFSGIPGDAKTLVLILEDPDAPAGAYTHWIMWNIPPNARIDENSVPQGAVQGVNTAGTNRYESPCPPYGTHRYVFKAYALDTVLSLSQKSMRADLEKAMEGHILASASLTGLKSKR